MGQEAVLSIRNISKNFGATKALTNVSVDFYPGQIHGLIGENGSGKSTVSNVVMGVYQPNSGTMLYKGNSYSPVNMMDAIANHICMVVQEMATINNLSVADNIFLGMEKDFAKGKIINTHQMNDEAKKVLRSVELDDIDPSMSINKLSFEDRKLVEVGRAMYQQPEILIVDETTTALSQRGRNIMYQVMTRLASENKCVILISHDIEELMQYADAVSVLRDGHFVATVQKEELDENVLKSLMIGRELGEHYYREDYDVPNHTETVIKVTDLCFEREVRHVNLELRKGEILGIGGLTDSGMHRLGRLMFGIDKPDSGKVHIVEDNTEVKNPKVAVSHKMAYLSKNRDQESLMVNSTIEENIISASLDKVKRGCFLSLAGIRRLAENKAAQMEVKMQEITSQVASLSGGNRQKVVIAKWLANDSDILILDCPTRGIDIGVKASIYRLMERLKAENKAILMISEEMPELMGMSDRILIMKNGEITQSFERNPALTEQDIIKYMI